MLEQERDTDDLVVQATRFRTRCQPGEDHHSGRQRRRQHGKILVIPPRFICFIKFDLAYFPCDLMCRDIRSDLVSYLGSSC